MLYYLVVDEPQRADFLVVEVLIDGPAQVVGRWDTRKAAQADADRWMALEELAA